MLSNYLKKKSHDAMCQKHVVNTRVAIHDEKVKNYALTEGLIVRHLTRCRDKLLKKQTAHAECSIASISLSLLLSEGRVTPRTLNSDHESVFVVEVDSAEEPGRLAKRGKGFLTTVSSSSFASRTHIRAGSSLGEKILPFSWHRDLGQPKTPV